MLFGTAQNTLNQQHWAEKPTFYLELAFILSPNFVIATS